MQRFAVIGLGRFGYQVAVSLAELGAEVLAIDKQQDICDQLKQVQGVNPLCFDATDESALKKSQITDVDAAVVAVGAHLESSIIITALLHKLPISRIIARASSELHARILRHIGATQIYSPEVEMGRRAAEEIASPDAQRRTEIATGHVMMEVDVREHYWDKPLKELALRERYEVNVIAIKSKVSHVGRDGSNSWKEATNMAPSPSDILKQGDRLVVLGTHVRIQDFLDVW